MKEMVYMPTRTDGAIILDKGNINGYAYRIVSYGTHPCAYVDIPQTSKVCDIYTTFCENDEIDVHGGITYARDYLFSKDFGEEQGHWIGWDYAHWDDYSGYFETVFPFPFGGKKWTTPEIFADVKSVIRQLKELE